MKTACTSQPTTEARINHQDINEQHVPEIDEFPPSTPEKLAQIKSIYNRDEGSNILPQKKEYSKESRSLTSQTVQQERTVTIHRFSLKYLIILPFLVLALSIYYYPFEKTYHANSALIILKSSDTSSSLIRTIENLNLRESFKTSRETFNGSKCEQVYSEILQFLNTNPVTEMKHLIEVLVSSDNSIEENCPPSLEEINPDIFYKMSAIYSYSSTGCKQLKWLRKIENVLPQNPVNSPFISIFIKMYISLASWYTKDGNYGLSISKFEEAQKLLKNYPVRNSDEHIRLQSWFLEIYGEYNFARYRASQNAGEKELLYKDIEKLYLEAIDGNLSQNQLLFAGFAQCGLAEFYIEAKDYEKAEEINRRGKKSIKIFFNQEEDSLGFLAKCIRNDDLIDILKGPVLEGESQI